MKKILYGVMAATMIFATSCENELEVGAAGEESVVSFTIATPDMGSRADYSDGTTATVLQYAVYEGETELTDLTKSVVKGNAETINGSKEVQLKLTTGNTYSVVFWAAAPNAPYTVDFGAKTMTVDYTNAVSNDEARDAFYAKETFTVTGAQTETITLKRPFAQLNIGTNDYAASTSAGYTPTHSAVTVKNLKNTLNFFDGTVTGDDEARVFASAAIPAGQEFPVAGYEYLAMNYLLVGADKTVVDVEFTYTDGSDAKTRTVGSVPVQRNYRTNIYGQLLTSDVDVNVEIEPDYQGSHVAEALFLAAAVGGEVTLTEDVVLTAPLEVQANMVINLNGNTISAAYHKNIGAVIKNKANLTIVGGTISSLGENGGSAIQNSGKLTVKDATLNGAPNANGSWPSYTVNNTGEMTMENTTITSYHGAVASYGADAIVTLNNCEIDMTGIPGFTSHGIYTYDNGKVVVNGGTYANKATDQNASGASVINGAVTVNSGDFSGRIENYYGTPVLKGGSYSVRPNNNFIAAGFKAVENGGKYYVVADEIDAVASTADELNDALASGNDVALGNDIAVAKSEAGSNGYGATGISQLNGGVIDGNGNDVSVDAWGTWDSAINTTGGTIKNLNVTGGMRGIFVNHNSTNNSKVVLENVTIDGTVYTISCDQGTNNGLEAYNSTFNGWTSYAATIGAVKFNGCSFGEGQGYKFCRPYAATEFVGCNFAAGYELDARAAVTFENCTIGGVALTADNLATLVVGGIANATVK